MPIPRSVGVFNKHVTNKLFIRLAGWLGPLAIIGHIGRRSGKLYHTPVMAFRTSKGFLFALTYGKSVDWVKNLQASEEGTLLYKGEEFHLRHFKIVRCDEGNELFPNAVRSLLNIISVKDCLEAEVLE
jgi:deazaflavin-dependent oxidoreductase (nitroreductase family)